MKVLLRHFSGGYLFKLPICGITTTGDVTLSATPKNKDKHYHCLKDDCLSNNFHFLSMIVAFCLFHMSGQAHFSPGHCYAAMLLHFLHFVSLDLTLLLW